MTATDDLADEIATLAANVDATMHRMLTCIRAFDEGGGWHGHGALSCAHWLSWRIGLDPATARERVRVARALEKLPAIDDALRRGAISYVKVRALTRVATPQNDAQLAQLALAATGAQLERICRGYRQIVVNEAGALPTVVRGLRRLDLPNGTVKLEIVVQPDEAALILKAVDKARDEIRATHVQSDVSAETPSGADAAVMMAESFLSQETTRGNAAERYEVLVHLDQEPLAADGAWAATLDDGTRVSAERLRRVACDAGVVPVVSNEKGDVLDVGRRTRTISPALRRALWVRDRGCRFPGCGNTRFVHGHHIRHWLHGGRTSLDNLVLLCSAHHRKVHEEGFVVRMLGGAVAFASPNDELIPAVPAAVDVEDGAARLHEWAEARGVEIAPDTNLASWDGEPIDYAYASEALYAATS